MWVFHLITVDLIRRLYAPFLQKQENGKMIFNQENDSCPRLN